MTVNWGKQVKVKLQCCFWEVGRVCLSWGGWGGQCGWGVMSGTPGSSDSQQNARAVPLLFTPHCRGVLEMNDA